MFMSEGFPASNLGEYREGPLKDILGAQINFWLRGNPFRAPYISVPMTSEEVATTWTILK